MALQFEVNAAKRKESDAYWPGRGALKAGMKERLLAGAAAAFLLAGAVDSQPVGAAAALTYADLADLALAAPVAAHVRLVKAVPLKPAEAGVVPAGMTRFYVESDVVSLIRGAEGLPARIGYLADVPSAANGKAPKLARKSEYLVLGRTVPGRPAELRLVAPDAQIPFTAERAQTIRSVLQQSAGPDAAPRISGIGKAFHVPGALPGESETQIFLQTDDARPVSLSILRRPGEQPRWALALGEMVDDAAEPPKPNTLLWYRLACTLPAALPARSLADAEAEQRSAIAADYRLVIDALGPCARSRR
jgi:hypothetical protein